MKFENECIHISRQLIALAEATPADKFSWRPAAEVRSTSEVYMHIVAANFGLLSFIGSPAPSDMSANMEKTVTTKMEVIAWLKRSLDAVKVAHAAATPQDLERKVKMPEPDANVYGIYLRIVVHASEHMGQLIAYARMAGIKLPTGRSGMYW